LRGLLVDLKFKNKFQLNQITKISERLNFPIVLIGGEEEKPTGDLIKENCKELVIKNFCGVLDLDQSALIIEHSFCLFSNDTGMMHIGAALNKKIVSFWGCTKPDMGFYPYVKEEKSLLIVSPNSKRQCSKHGDSCRYSKDGCIKHIEIDENLIEKNIEIYFLENNAFNSVASSACIFPPRIKDN
jgi:heptosyltransferase-2